MRFILKQEGVGVLQVANICCWRYVIEHAGPQCSFVTFLPRAAVSC